MCSDSSKPGFIYQDQHQTQITSIHNKEDGDLNRQMMDTEQLLLDKKKKNQIKH